MTSFATTLKHLRTARGLSQTRLAELAKLDHSYISRLERDTDDRDREWSRGRNPTPASIAALAAALALSDVEHDGLLVSAGFMPRDPWLRQIVLDWVGMEAA